MPTDRAPKARLPIAAELNRQIAPILTEAFERDLKELVPTVGGNGPFYLGMLTYTAAGVGIPPTRDEMEAIARCASMQEANDYCTAWLERHAAQD